MLHQFAKVIILKWLSRFMGTRTVRLTLYYLFNLFLTFVWVSGSYGMADVLETSLLVLTGIRLTNIAFYSLWFCCILTLYDIVIFYFKQRNK
jgi:hypothetical protein